MISVLVCWNHMIVSGWVWSVCAGSVTDDQLLSDSIIVINNIIKITILHDIIIINKRPCARYKVPRVPGYLVQL